MKKLFTTIAALFLLTAGLHAQGLKLGVQISPDLSVTRLNLAEEGVNIFKESSKLRFKAGLMVDAFLTEKFALTTGGFFVTKAANYKISEEVQTLNLQYIQLPIALKLYTDNITPLMKLYFQAGGTLDIKVAEKLDGFKADYTSLMDAGILLGLGTEFEIGTHSLFAGINYNRGLFDIVREDLTVEDAESVSKDLFDLKTDSWSLVVGFKF